MKTTQRTEISGTDTRVFSAWEDYNGHGEMRTIGGSTMGRIGTRRFPCDLAAMPAFSAERSESVQDWYEAQYQEAYAVILDSWPHLGMNGGCDARRSMGEIITDN